MGQHTRRRLLAAGLAAPLVLGRAAAEPAFPSRPVRIVVPFTPGASTDQIARLLAQRLGDTWKRTVLVDNRPGGATQIGTDLVAKAPPDGHTMLMAGFAFGVNPSVLPKPPYDTLRDFAPVVLCVATPNLLVVARTSRSTAWRNCWPRRRQLPTALHSHPPGPQRRTISASNS